jgi:prevent-host-death family protein
MESKEVNVSEVRKNLRSFLAQVQRTGRPVVILRRGVPQAVLLSYEQYLLQASKEGEPEWQLRGSMKASPDLDIDEAIAQVRSTSNLDEFGRWNLKWDLDGPAFHQ